MKGCFRNSQKIQITFFAFISFLSMSPVANAFLFVQFTAYKVKDIHPFGLSNVVILEEKAGEEKWYLIKSGAIADCNIKKGDTIRAKLSTDSKKFEEYINSEKVGYLQRKFIENLGNRLLFRVRGCYNLEDELKK